MPNRYINGGTASDSYTYVATEPCEPEYFDEEPVDVTEEAYRRLNGTIPIRLHGVWRKEPEYNCMNKYRKMLMF